jgi:hypothetical protein
LFLLITGMIVGGLLTSVVVAIGIGLLVPNTQQATHAKRPKALGVNLSADEQWKARWPSLQFPPRKGGVVPESVRVAYDRFDDYTSFEVEIDLLGRYKMAILTTETGNVARPLSPPRDLLVGIYKPNAGIDNNLVFLADAKRIAPSHDHGSWEHAWFRLQTEDLLTMIASSSVQGRVNSEVFELRDSDVKTLADLASTLGP